MSKRDQILDAAIALFNSGGFHAVGVDAIVEAAGVAKMTLYNHFPSKDDLIVATLERRSDLFQRWLDSAVEPAGDDPRAKILAVFDAVRGWYRHREFNGCVFTRACGEFPDDHPAHQAGKRHAERLTGFFLPLCEGVGAEDPEALCNQLIVLFLGATAAASILCTCASAACAKSAAAALIDAETVHVDV